MNPAPTPRAESSALGDFAKVMSVDRPIGPPRIALNPDDTKNGLARLVLALVELIRELLERQAVRRIEAGSLTDPEIERLGTTFMQLAEHMETLKAQFGLEGDDLNIDLGPLGKLF